MIVRYSKLYGLNVMFNQTNVVKNFKDNILSHPLYGKIKQGLSNKNINYNKYYVNFKILKCGIYTSIVNIIITKR